MTVWQQELFSNAALQHVHICVLCPRIPPAESAVRPSCLVRCSPSVINYDAVPVMSLSCSDTDLLSDNWVLSAGHG